MKWMIVFLMMFVLVGGIVNAVEVVNMEDLFIFPEEYKFLDEMRFGDAVTIKGGDDLEATIVKESGGFFRIEYKGGVPNQLHQEYLLDLFQQSTINFQILSVDSTMNYQGITNQIESSSRFSLEEGISSGEAPAAPVPGATPNHLTPDIVPQANQDSNGDNSPPETQINVIGGTQISPGSDSINHAHTRLRLRDEEGDKHYAYGIDAEGNEKWYELKGGKWEQTNDQPNIGDHTLPNNKDFIPANIQTWRNNDAGVNTALRDLWDGKEITYGDGNFQIQSGGLTFILGDGGKVIEIQSGDTLTAQQIDNIMAQYNNPDAINSRRQSFAAAVYNRNGLDDSGIPLGVYRSVDGSPGFRLVRDRQTGMLIKQNTDGTREYITTDKELAKLKKITDNKDNLVQSQTMIRLGEVYGFVSTMLNFAQSPVGRFGSLLYGKNEISEMQREADQRFKEMFFYTLTDQGLTERVCSTRFPPMIGDNQVLGIDPSGRLQQGITLQAERARSWMVNETNETTGEHHSEERFVYKFAIRVSNLNVENESIRFTVTLHDERGRVVRLYDDPITLDRGRTFQRVGRGMDVVETTNKYDRICIKFSTPYRFGSQYDISFYEKGEIMEFCNRVSVVEGRPQLYIPPDYLTEGLTDSEGRPVDRIDDGTNQRPSPNV